MNSQPTRRSILTSCAVGVGRVTTAACTTVRVVLTTAVRGDQCRNAFGVDASRDLNVGRRLLDVWAVLPDVAAELLLVSAGFGAERLRTVAAIFRCTDCVAVCGKNEALCKCESGGTDVRHLVHT